MNGSEFSAGNSKRGNASEAFNENTYDESDSEVATSEYDDSDDKMYLGSESHIGIHTYGDKQGLVISDSDHSREEEILDEKPSSNKGIVEIKQERKSDNVTDTMGREAMRGRSLWGIGRGSERHRIEKVDEEEGNQKKKAIFPF